MEVLKEESRLLMESMIHPFTRHVHDEKETARLLSSDQSVLLIHRPGEEYKLTQNQCIPEVKSDHEILIKVLAVGLNPIDWKGPDYNFGLPSLPWINGRDFAGVVVKAHRSLSRIRVGDVILSPSTDYGDIRKAAFQEYVISTEHNSARVPGGFPVQNSAAIGVAFLTAALALASSATGLVALQLAKLARLRTICIVDVARYGESLLEAGADLLVDRLDTDRAIAIVRGVTRNRLRFALDTVGEDTAANLQETLDSSGDRSHLVGLSGLPRTHKDNVLHHHVPLKVFHDVPKIRESLMIRLEKLLLTQKLIAPQVEVAVGGLSGINQALDKLRNGTVTGKRLVVPLQDQTVKIA